MVQINTVKRTEETFQMALMIDMVFLLLGFFMCVSVLAQADKTVELGLPESSESQVADIFSNRGKYLWMWKEIYSYPYRSLYCEKCRIR